MEKPTILRIQLPNILRRKSAQGTLAKPSSDFNFLELEMESLDNVGNVRYQVWLDVLLRSHSLATLACVLTFSAPDAFTM